MKTNPIYRKNRLYKAVALTLLLTIVPAAMHAAQRDDLYDLGRKAFEEGDYIDALKNLSAFYAINETEIKIKPEFNEAMLEKIQKCEAVLRLALAKSAPFHFQGHRTITIEIPTNSGTAGGGIKGTGREINLMITNGGLDLKKISELSKGKAN